MYTDSSILVSDCGEVGAYLPTLPHSKQNTEIHMVPVF